jgi:transposase
VLRTRAAGHAGGASPGQPDAAAHPSAGSRCAAQLACRWTRRIATHDPACLTERLALNVLKGYCTQAANRAARIDTFLGERLRRLSRRLGGNRAKCAVARSILVIIWHLLANPEARFTDLGSDWHDRKTDRDRKIRAHLRQLQALGLEVTITPAA